MAQIEKDQQYYKGELDVKNEEIKGLRKEITLVTENRDKERYLMWPYVFQREPNPRFE